MKKNEYFLWIFAFMTLLFLIEFNKRERLNVFENNFVLTEEIDKKVDDITKGYLRERAVIKTTNDIILNMAQKLHNSKDVYEDERVAKATLKAIGYISKNKTKITEEKLLKIHSKITTKEKTLKR